MSALLAAVFVAGFLGSAHCLGMCGPLVLAATVPSGTSERRGTLSRLVAFQGGRLVVYTALGALAGSLGAALDLAGALAGMASTAMWVAGALMVAGGIRTLAQLVRWRLTAPSDAPGAPPARKPGLLQTLPRRVGALLPRLPKSLRPALLGATTGLLPCGFLWSFAVGAAGTGRATEGSLVMAAFALGTAPATFGLAGLAATVGRRLGAHTTAVVALITILLGLATVMRREQFDVRAWAAAATDGASAAEEPPCCHDAAEATTATQNEDAALAAEPPTGGAPK